MYFSLECIFSFSDNCCFFMIDWISYSDKVYILHKHVVFSPLNCLPLQLQQQTMIPNESKLAFLHKDPMGTAIADYLHHNKADKLRVFSSQFEENEIPAKSNDSALMNGQMPETGTDCLTNGRRKYSGRRSRKAVLPCTGLARDGRGTAIDISPLFCRSNGKKRGKECPSDESFRSAFSRNIRYNPHA